MCRHDRVFFSSYLGHILPLSVYSSRTEVVGSTHTHTHSRGELPLALFFLFLMFSLVRVRHVTFFREPDLLGWLPLALVLGPS